MIVNTGVSGISEGVVAIRKMSADEKKELLPSGARTGYR